MCVCTRVLEEEGGGSFLIREQLVSRKWLFGTGCSAEVGMFMVLMLSEVSEEHSVHKEGGGFPSQAAGLVSVPKVCSFQPGEQWEDSPPLLLPSMLTVHQASLHVSAALKR